MSPIWVYRAPICHPPPLTPLIPRTRAAPTPAAVDTTRAPARDWAIALGQDWAITRDTIQATTRSTLARWATTLGIPALDRATVQATRWSHPVTPCLSIPIMPRPRAPICQLWPLATAAAWIPNTAPTVDISTRRACSWCYSWCIPLPILLTSFFFHNLRFFS